MASYSYKGVCFRDDFIAMVEEWKAKQIEDWGREDYDGSSDYDGDNWAVAAMLLNAKDKRISELEANQKEN